MTGVRGQPPPPTTKLAIFFRGGFQSQILLNATGYATGEKWLLYEAQIRYGLRIYGVEDRFDVLEFQVVGVNAIDPQSQLSSTTYCRLFAQAACEDTIRTLLRVIGEFGMQHFSGILILCNSQGRKSECSTRLANVFTCLKDTTFVWTREPQRHCHFTHSIPRLSHKTSCMKQSTSSPETGRLKLPCLQAIPQSTKYFSHEKVMTVVRQLVSIPSARQSRPGWAISSTRAQGIREPISTSACLFAVQMPGHGSRHS